MLFGWKERRILGDKLDYGIVVLIDGDRLMFTLNQMRKQKAQKVKRQNYVVFGDGEKSSIFQPGTVVVIIVLDFVHR